MAEDDGSGAGGGSVLLTVLVLLFLALALSATLLLLVRIRRRRRFLGGGSRPTRAIGGGGSGGHLGRKVRRMLMAGPTADCLAKLGLSGTEGAMASSPVGAAGVLHRRRSVRPSLI